jgi:hypothetical protein
MARGAYIWLKMAYYHASQCKKREGPYGTRHESLSFCIKINFSGGFQKRPTKRPTKWGIGGFRSKIQGEEFSLSQNFFTRRSN